MKAVPTPEAHKRQEGIPIKYGRITNQDFTSGLERLKVFVDFKDPKDIWRMAKFVKGFEAAELRARKWYRKLIDKHAEREPIQKLSKITNKMEDARDKDGKPMTRPKQAPGPGGRLDFVFKDKALFNADLKVFDNHIDVIKVLKFEADDMIKAKLTPVELAACVMMIDNPPEDLADAVAEFEAEFVREDQEEEEGEDGEEAEEETTAEAPQEETAQAPAN